MGPSALGRKLAWLSSEALTAAAAVTGLLAFSEVLVQQQPERSIAQWQALMSAGAVSAVEIVEHDLARIDAIDHSELKAGIDAYLRERPDAPVRGLADVIAFNAQNADRVMPYFRPEFLEMAQAEAGLDDPAYLEALAACRRIARDEGIDRAPREQRLDVLIAPTGTPPAGSPPRSTRTTPRRSPPRRTARAPPCSRVASSAPLRGGGGCRRGSALADNPTLIVWGMRDIAFRAKELRRWHTLFPAARTVALDDVGHYVQEEVPEPLADEVAAFLGVGAPAPVR